MKIHADITLDIVINAVERQTFGTDNPGFCISCGEEQGGCEPDARGYPCECCNENTVYGAEELLITMA